MSSIRYELVSAEIFRAENLLDTGVHDDIHKQHEFRKQKILAGEILTKDEKTYAIRRITQDYDYHKILFNLGTRRTCENCNQECLATLYCEYCIRNYLEANF